MWAGAVPRRHTHCTSLRNAWHTHARKTPHRSMHRRGTPPAAGLTRSPTADACSPGLPFTTPSDCRCCRHGASRRQISSQPVVLDCLQLVIRQSEMVPDLMDRDMGHSPSADRGGGGRGQRPRRWVHSAAAERHHEGHAAKLAAGRAAANAVARSHPSELTAASAA